MRFLSYEAACKCFLLHLLRILRGKLKDLATRGGGNTRWGGLVLITTEDEAIEVQGRFKIWQEWGETRVLGKRVYFESKVLKSFEEREEFGEGCSGLLGDCLSVNKGIMKSLL